MRALLLGAVALAVPAAPASAQMAMDHAMPGMTMPAKKPAPIGRAPARKRTRPAPANHAGKHEAAAGHALHDMPGMATGGDKPAAPPAGHDMASMPGMAMGQGPMPASPTIRLGTDLPPGDASPPLPSPGLAASLYYGEPAMAAADRDLRREHGGMTVYQVLFNLAEYQARAGGDGYRWDGEAWIGGDIDRFAIKSEGEGTVAQRLDHAEVQALYSRAIDPYWNLQAGIRHDVRPRARTYATVGVEGLAPYWFEVEGALFVSDRGDVLGRAEAWYDERVTQFLVLQPRVEANLAAQDVRRDGIGAGLTDLELGLRLRYEKSREVAPYVGMTWERQFGDTARFTRGRGGDTGGFGFVAGLRTWF